MREERRRDGQMNDRRRRERIRCTAAPILALLAWTEPGRGFEYSTMGKGQRRGTGEAQRTSVQSEAYIMGGTWACWPMRAHCASRRLRRK